MLEALEEEEKEINQAGADTSKSISRQKRKMVSTRNKDDESTEKLTKLELNQLKMQRKLKNLEKENLELKKKQQKQQQITLCCDGTVKKTSKVICSTPKKFDKNINLIIIFQKCK